MVIIMVIPYKSHINSLLIPLKPAMPRRNRCPQRLSGRRPYAPWRPPRTRRWRRRAPVSAPTSWRCGDRWPVTAVKGCMDGGYSFIYIYMIYIYIWYMIYDIYIYMISVSFFGISIDLQFRALKDRNWVASGPYKIADTWKSNRHNVASWLWRLEISKLFRTHD